MPQDDLLVFYLSMCNGLPPVRHAVGEATTTSSALISLLLCTCWVATAICVPLANMVPNLPLVLALCFLFVQHASTLWPIPSSLSSGTAAVKLSPNFAIHLDVAHPPADLLSAISRTRSRLHSDTFERLVLGRASADAQAIKKAHIVTSLTVGLRPGSPARSIAEETTKSLGDKDESYELSVPDEGPSATLVANSTLGLLRGLTTFEQLWYDSAGTKYMLDGPLRVADQPAFVCYLSYELMGVD